VIISRIECGQEFSELLIVTFCIYYLYAICEAWSCKV
jgi:isoprenylcysteine carboxyl methyltransferase (ICMT) family protein YpbQ